jgi:homoserine kinase
MIKVFAPATVANLACGFDVLGLALNEPGDIVEVGLNDKGIIEVLNESGVALPLEPENNVTTVAIQAMLDTMKSKQGVSVVFKQKIHLGSGIGSSAASSVAGVYGLNELLGRPFNKTELVTFAMEGEKLASGSAHADNIAPAIFGGVTLVRGYNPLDIVEISYPEDLACVIVFPQIEVKTKDSRSILPKEIPLKEAIKQWGNLAGLVAGLMKGDYKLIGNSLHDGIVEPVRSMLIPGFYDVKETAMKAGALGCSISGAGPSIFSLCQGLEKAAEIAEKLRPIYKNLNIDFELYVSKINNQGTKIIP